MFRNILVWNFKSIEGEITKELDVHLDPNTPIDFIEQVAIQMIAHCAKVKEAAKQQQEQVKADEQPAADIVPEESKVEEIPQEV